MNQVTFRPAIREAVGLIIGLIGPSGGGKTYSAMRLASGICGDKRFAVIDTEAGRAKHYADQFKFDHADLKSPFRPTAYVDAIVAADEAKYPVIVVDSCSHEWAGEGGILDWQEEELTRMAGDDWKKREACRMAAWIRPKMAHKQMVQRLLQVRAHLILCFRAEEKVRMEEIADDRGRRKTVIVPIGFQPICEKNLPYELTVSFLLTPDTPGVPKPLKLQAQHRPIFPDGQPINEEAGQRLAQWASGAKGGEAVDTRSMGARAPAETGLPAVTGGAHRTNALHDLDSDPPWDDDELADSDLLKKFTDLLEIANSRSSLIELGREIAQTQSRLTVPQVDDLRLRLNEKLKQYPKEPA